MKQPSKNKQCFRFINSTREKYPTFRVDLTALLSKGLAGKGHKIDWHMQSMEPARSSLEVVNEQECVYVGTTHSGKGVLGKIINHLSALYHDLSLYQIIKRNDYDFVQVRDKAFAALIGLVAAKSKGIPFYYWMSFPYVEADAFRAKDREIQIPGLMRAFYRLRGMLTGWILYRLVLPRADYVFVQSDQMKHDVAAQGIDQRIIFPVPMGIDDEKLLSDSVLASDDARLKGRIPLVYVGSMVRVRRMEFLFHVLKIIKKEKPEALLVMVGDAPENDMRFLRDEAKRLDVAEDVLFTGFVPMDEAWGYIREAKVCLSPIRPSSILNVSSPTKVIEYLAWGKPVVANTIPDQTVVLNESGGGLAVDYTPEAFAEAILRILKDERLAEEMTLAGPGYVKQHRSYAMLSQKLEHQYLNLPGMTEK